MKEILADDLGKLEEASKAIREAEDALSEVWGYIVVSEHYSDNGAFSSKQVGDRINMTLKKRMENTADDDDLSKVFGGMSM